MGAKWNDAVANRATYTASITIETSGAGIPGVPRVVRAVTVMHGGTHRPAAGGLLAVPRDFMQSDAFDDGSDGYLQLTKPNFQLRRIELVDHASKLPGRRDGYYQHVVSSKGTPLPGTWTENASADSFTLVTNDQAYSITVILRDRVDL